METSQEIALTQMKKAVQELDCSPEGYGDLTLMRFLIARSMDPEKAAKMFAQWVKWRASFVPSGSIDESEIPIELEQKKFYLQGLAKNGCPLVVARGCKHFPTKDHLQFKKIMVHVLDKAIASTHGGGEVGNEKIIGILDFKDVTYKNVDLRSIITGFQFIQSYYPERLLKAFIVDMPWFIASGWKLVSRFLDKATLNKIVMVTSEAEKQQIIDEIGVDVLPEIYGGKAKLIALQDFKLTPQVNP